MKNDIQKLVESFGENSRIGDVLEKIAKLHKDNLLYGDLIGLGQAWQPLGFTKSLQEIYAECEWQTPVAHINMGEQKIMPCERRHHDLFEFLLQLGL